MDTGKFCAPVQRSLSTSNLILKDTLKKEEKERET
jgi:hypothetical protein